MNGRSEAQETHISYLFILSESPRSVLNIYGTMLFFFSIDSLIQHIEQLVEHILAEGVARLR